MMCAVAVFSSCEEDRWTDNTIQEIYFPQHGYSFNDVWDVEGGVYNTKIGITCGGVRPVNQTEDIVVNFQIDQAMVDAYNADITQEYSGQTVMLPQNCYSISGNSATIRQGEVSTTIDITFNTEAVKAACTDESKHYVIPFKLMSASSKSLSADESFTEMFYAVSVKTPSFFFFCNEYGVLLNSAKVLWGSDANVERYQIAGLGVPKGEYHLNVKYDPDALEPEYPIADILPEDAFSINAGDLVYKSEYDRARLEVRFDYSKLDFLRTYYLPITVEGDSNYKGAEGKKTLFVKVELKNPYEKTYASKIYVLSDATGRNAAYSAKKSPVSITEDIIEMQMSTNSTIAGAKASAASSATYNNKYFRIKVLPKADSHRYGVEIIQVTDKGTKNNSPATLEADPDKESYYDWDSEMFVLNYRWQHTDKSWIYVTETIQAN